MNEILFTFCLIICGLALLTVCYFMADILEEIQTEDDNDD